MKKAFIWISIIILGIVIICSIVSMVVVIKVYDSSFTKVERPDYSITAGIRNYDDIKDNYPRENISFYSNENK